MLELAGNLVRTLILIVMVAALLDMLIPQSRFRQYLRMVIGMLVLLMVINTLGNLAGRSLNFVWPSFSPEEEEYASIMEEGRKLWEHSRELALEQYRITLALYLEEELRTRGEWELDMLEVFMEENPEQQNFGRLKGARVFISAAAKAAVEKEEPVSIAVDPVRIDVERSGRADGEGNGNEEKERAKNEEIWELERMVAGWLQLPAEAVEVHLIK